MKYLKYFKFFEDKSIDSFDSDSTQDSGLESKTKKTISDSIDEIQRDLKDFQAKKTRMESIFKDPKISTDVDLDKALQADIYNNQSAEKERNRFLKGYESVLRSERRMNAISHAIERDEDQIKIINDDINRLKSLRTTSSEKRINEIDQILDRNKSRLKDLKDNITKNKSILSTSGDSLQKDQDKFKKYMKSQEDNIRSLSKM